MQDARLPSISSDQLEKLADNILLILLNDRRFVDRWTENVEEALRKIDNEQQVSVSMVPGTSGHDSNRHQKALICAVNELSRGIDLATQTFLSAVDISICHNDPEHNRDASALFSMKLQVERMACRFRTKVDILRIEASIRRLIQLLRTFTTRIRSSFQITNCSTFASALCDILYTFDSNIAVIPGYYQFASYLRRSIDDFNEIVVDRLLLLLKYMTYSNEKVPHKLFLTPQLKKRRPLMQLQHRSSGLLMPRKSWKSRQREIRIRSVSANRMASGTVSPCYNTAPLKFSPPKKHNGKFPHAVEIERKWMRLLEAEKVFKTSVGCKGTDEPTIRLARKISSEVLRDLQQKMGDIDLAGIQC